MAVKSKANELEHARNSLYIALTHYRLLKQGHQDFDGAKKMILKYMSIGMPEGEYRDMKKYYGMPISYYGPEMCPNLYRKDETVREEWEAMEFFGLIQVS